MVSLKKNILLNAINTISGIIFPIITFPYAARILMPEGIGSINFLNGIITYIVVGTSLGIPLYAVKQIAQHRQHIIERNRITAEVIILSLILSAVGYIIVWLCATFVPRIHAQSALFYVLSITILFNAIGAGWFYQGIEDFKYITVRSLIVRAISAILLFIFVKTPEDIILYALIVVLISTGNNIINFVHLRKYISLSDLTSVKLNILRHLAPSLKVFSLTLIISLYQLINVIMLGFICGDTEVGYYTGGDRIVQIAIVCITSAGTVLLPRCSALVAEGNREQFKIIIAKSLRLSVAASLPVITGLLILSTQIILTFCGTDYLNSIPVLMLGTPTMLIISISNVIGIQVLYPLNKIKLMIASTAAGLTVNVILNYILIPHLGACGASISAIAAETTVLLVQLCIARSLLPIKLTHLPIANYLTATAIMAIALIIVTNCIHSPLSTLIIGVPTGAVIYIAFLYLIKDSLITSILPRN